MKNSIQISINYENADLQTSGSIWLDISTIQSIDDIKKAFASKFQIDAIHLDIKNPPTAEMIKAGIINYTLQIELVGFNHDIDFYFPNDKIIQIKNAYKMTYKHLISELKSNGCYFSDLCLKKRMHMDTDNIELDLKREYPFLYISTHVNVDGDFVILEYSNKMFILSNCEKAKRAYKLIDECFWDSDSILIYEGNDYMEKSYRLFSDSQYKIVLVYSVIFYLKYNSFSVRIPFSNLPTAHDAQQYLSLVYVPPVNPEIIEIYDKHLNVINDLNKPLNEIQAMYKKFYFCLNTLRLNRHKRNKSKKTKIKSQEEKKEEEEQKIEMKSQEDINIAENEGKSIVDEDVNQKKKIKKVKIKMPSVKLIDDSDDHETESNMFLPIVIKFEPEKRIDLEQLRINVLVSTTIKEIEKIILENRPIKGEMIFKYLLDGQKVVVDPDTKIEEIKDKIKQKESNGKVVNQLFVEIVEKQPNKDNEKTVAKDEEKDDTKKSPEKVDKKYKRKISSVRPTIKRISYDCESDDSDDDDKEKETLVKPMNKKKEKDFDDKKIPKKAKSKKAISYDSESDDSDNKEEKIPRKPVNKKQEKDSDIKTSKKEKPKKPISYDSESDDSDDDDDTKIPRKPIAKKQEKESDNDDDTIIPRKPIAKKQEKESDNDDDTIIPRKPIAKKQEKYDDDDEKESDDDDDDDDEYIPKKSKKHLPKSKFMPKKVEISQPSNKTEYLFKYDENSKTIPMGNDSTFASKESMLKKAFKIKQKDQIKFFVIGQKGEEKEVTDKNDKLAKYKSATSIKIVLQQRRKDEPESNKINIKYQTNNDKKIFDVELDQDATVKNLKEYIQKNNKVKNFANIKIIFAGKELLNDIVLKSLNVGDTVLFVYIRTEEDIFLLTAKALQYGNESSSSYDDDDDDKK